MVFYIFGHSRNIYTQINHILVHFFWPTPVVLRNMSGNAMTTEPLLNCLFKTIYLSLIIIPIFILKQPSPKCQHCPTNFPPSILP